MPTAHEQVNHLASFETLYRRLPSVPLAHYTDAAGLAGILRSGALWATHAQYLNDAREFSHAVDLARAKLKSSSTSDPLASRLLGQLDSMEGNTWVVSFSEEPDLLSQWRAYCPQGGYSVAFDSTAIAALAAAQRFVLVQCVYDSMQQRQLVSDLIDAARAEFPNFSLDMPDGSAASDDERASRFASQWFFPKMLRLGCSLKDPAFFEEKEWRLLGGLYKPHVVPKTRARGSLLVPYREFSLQQGDKIECIQSVLIGPMGNSELASKGVFFLKQSLKANNFPVATSNIPLRAPPE